MLLTQEQIKAIYDEAKGQLHKADPLPILQALNLNVIQVNPASYKLTLRNENHASAFISFKNNRWIFKDFGSGENGTIENIVMLVNRINYKDALTYCLSTLNQHEPIIQNSSTYPNLLQATYVYKSKVIRVSEPLAPSILTYLKSRNIIKVPPEFKAIEGVYYNKNNEPKKVFGVGILNDSEGGDIHFLKQVGSLKTMNLGAKDISFFKRENTSKIAIFESKMDYAAAYQSLDFIDVNVLVANSTSNIHKVLKLLQESSYNIITIFQQNDPQGRNFAHEIVKQANIKSFMYVQYNDDEEGLDVNDLLIKSTNIQERVTSHVYRRKSQHKK
ncbi:toprim domain-containing protein [Sulfurospirillum barnesii]|uniref:Toprim domain-containing protein n=1 Tax=Sulfurospirillum barnesii (strain ATCC 700032 / DSM 10660 / SES-3) TaxID=760154 RepID=I3XX72_SULBS|nr:toprim domain-containing protein [Sulfurospirillum barnesii]AFL68546.1 hypothetical protein Sulba_1252 [Sulfurospirillum barnesii SES-3]